MNHKNNRNHSAENCLLARRFSRTRRAVCFSFTADREASGINIVKIEEKHSKMCLSMDQGVGALLKDLKQRGLLDETAGCMGRRIWQNADEWKRGTGRDHNPTGFTMWMAGGGVKGGDKTIGATDELGLYAVEDRMHVQRYPHQHLPPAGARQNEAPIQPHGSPPKDQHSTKGEFPGEANWGVEDFSGSQ